LSKQKSFTYYLGKAFLFADRQNFKTPQIKHQNMADF